MLSRERGPLDLIDATALRPFAPAPSFSALAIDTAVQLGAHDAALPSVASDVGADLPVDVDDAFAFTIAPAADALGNEVTHGPGSPLPGLVAQGDNNDVIRQSVLAILPQPDSEFPTGFSDPPRPPGGGELPTDQEQRDDVRAIVDQRLAERGISSGGGGSGAPGGGGGGGDTGGDVGAVREAIRQDYLSLLGRDPDPGGWDFWTAKVETEGWTLDQVSAGIMDSDEYRNRHAAG